LQANRFRGALHVFVECGTVGIVGDGQVHPHGRQEVVEQLVADVVATCGVPHGGEYGIARVLVRGEELVAQLL